jgi:hypothetical protein
MIHCRYVRCWVVRAVAHKRERELTRITLRQAGATRSRRFSAPIPIDAAKFLTAADKVCPSQRLERGQLWRPNLVTLKTSRLEQERNAKDARLNAPTSLLLTPQF